MTDRGGLRRGLQAAARWASRGLFAIGMIGLTATLLLWTISWLYPGNLLYRWPDQRTLEATLLRGDNRIVIAADGPFVPHPLRGRVEIPWFPPGLQVSHNYGTSDQTWVFGARWISFSNRDQAGLKIYVEFWLAILFWAALVFATSRRSRSLLQRGWRQLRTMLRFAWSLESWELADWGTRSRAAAILRRAIFLVPAGAFFLLILIWCAGYWFILDTTYVWPSQSSMSVGCAYPGKIGFAWGISNPTKRSFSTPAVPGLQCSTEVMPPHPTDWLADNRWILGVAWNIGRSPPQSEEFGLIDAPIWILCMVMSVGGWCTSGPLRFAWRSRRRARIGLCSQCGYDLRASSGRCPECGNENVGLRPDRYAAAAASR